MFMCVLDEQVSRSCLSSTSTRPSFSPQGRLSREKPLHTDSQCGQTFYEVVFEFSRKPKIFKINKRTATFIPESRVHTKSKIVDEYSQVPNKRVYSFIPNEKVGLLF